MVSAPTAASVIPKWTKYRTMNARWVSSFPPSLPPSPAARPLSSQKSVSPSVRSGGSRRHSDGQSDIERGGAAARALPVLRFCVRCCVYSGPRFPKRRLCSRDRTTLPLLVSRPTRMSKSFRGKDGARPEASVAGSRCKTLVNRNPIPASRLDFTEPDCQGFVRHCRCFCD